MKSLSLSALTLSSLLLTTMLLNTKSCGASISLPEMDGDVPLYSIADSNIDLEFMMDSEINRILGTGSLNKAYDAVKRGPVFNCGPGNRYCVPGPDGKLMCRNEYKRDCKQFLSSTSSYSMPMICTYLNFRELVNSLSTTVIIIYWNRVGVEFNHTSFSTMGNIYILFPFNILFYLI